jgi:hypothetical protein
MAGLLKHQLVLTSTGLGTSTIRGAVVDGNVQAPYKVLIPASQTNLAITIPTIVVANLRSVFMTVDYATTLKTNSSGSPQETLSLSPLAPFSWQINSGITIPFAGNVTAWYATTGGTATTLTVFLLVN